MHGIGELLARVRVSDRSAERHERAHVVIPALRDVSSGRTACSAPRAGETILGNHRLRDAADAAAQVIAEMLDDPLSLLGDVPADRGSWISRVQVTDTALLKLCVVLGLLHEAVVPARIL